MPRAGLWLVGVPDSRLPQLERPGFVPIVAPREDLAVALAFGLQVGGEACCVFMKDAGLGHCLDSVLTTFLLAEQPLLMIVSSVQSQNGPEHHRIWGAASERILEAVDARVVPWFADRDLISRWRESRSFPLTVLMVSS